jgi:hypothetical protein
MKRFPVTLAAMVSVALVAPAKDFYLHVFHKHQLTDRFWGEGAHFGDFNRDGKNDIVSGPYWYEGPDFLKRHEYDDTTRKSPAGTAPFRCKQADGTETLIEGFEGGLGKNNAYSDNFFAFTYDLNRDGWTDILILGFPGDISAWYENPKGKPGRWTKHVALDVTDNESPTFTDLTGDGKPEIVCSSKGAYGYAEPDWSDPTKPWKWHNLSPNKNYHKFTHGMGVGDVNGDGRMDLLEKDGWWEQPKSLAGDPVWRHHPFPFAPKFGSAQMYAYDVNGDGKNDVVTSLAAHGYGLAWYEHVVANGEITFKKHIILPEQTENDKAPPPNKYGVVFSQLHAVDLIDMDGDGLKDIVTGKRFWAHGAHGDPDPNGPALLYWFQLVRVGKGMIDFVPHRIDDDSGIGTQVVAADLNADKLPEVVVGNKKGTFVFLHEKRKVSREEWEKAQPKVVPATTASAR